jgi:hypothetical protein
MVEWGRPQMTIWCMRIACWIPNATNTHPRYVLLIDLPLPTMVARTRLSVTLHLNYLSCFYFWSLVQGSFINLGTSVHSSSKEKYGKCFPVCCVYFSVSSFFEIFIFQLFFFFSKLEILQLSFCIVVRKCCFILS